MDAPVYHLTFHKCGSQWVRDVFTAEAVRKSAGVEAVPGLNLRPERWPKLEGRVFAGPFFGCAADLWARHRQPGEKAIVVMRDPRDQIVSWVFSMGNSHVETPITRLIRSPLKVLSLRHQLQVGMFWFRRIHVAVRSWARHPGDATVFLTSYEKLIASQDEFDRAFEFIGWNVPAEVRTTTLDQLSFKTRSGREPGEANAYSHYRKGVAGDWRNHFDHELGELFESLHPHLLEQMGYETEANWWESLPERVEPTESASASASAAELAALRAQVVRLTEERDELRRQR